MVSTILLILLTGCGSVYQQIEVPTNDNNESSRSFSSVVSDLKTPEEVYNWMQSNFSYQADKVAADEFRAPEETFQLRHGDCDDYARFAEYVLKQHGYEAEGVSVYSSDRGHAVCVWKDSTGKCNYLSNNSIRMISADDLNAVSKDIYSDWKVYSVYPSNDGFLRPAGS